MDTFNYYFTYFYIVFALLFTTGVYIYLSISLLKEGWRGITALALMTSLCGGALYVSFVSWFNAS